MATVDLTAHTFEQTITEHDIVLVDWWAEWCGPCKAFAPVFHGASERNEDIVFGKIDTEAEQHLAGSAGIRSIPTLMVFREGVLVFSQPGALPGHVLDDLIAQVREQGLEECSQVKAAYVEWNETFSILRHDNRGSDPVP